MKRLRLGSALLAAIVAFLANTTPSHAEEKKEPADSKAIGNYRREGIDVVQGRVFKKRGRSEFTIDGGIIANNTFLSYQLMQARYTYHIRETLAFEASYARVFNQEKDILGDLRNIPCPAAPGMLDADGDGIADTDCGVQLQNNPDPLKNLYFGNFVWSPLYGKFAIFSKKIFHFDIYVLAGAGLFDNERSNRFAFDVGIGAKVFLNDWFAIRTDLRNFTVREEAPFNHIVNNRTFSLGVSFFLPTKSYD